MHTNISAEALAAYYLGTYDFCTNFFDWNRSFDYHKFVNSRWVRGPCRPVDYWPVYASCGVTTQHERKKYGRGFWER